LKVRAAALPVGRVDPTPPAPRLLRGGDVESAATRQTAMPRAPCNERVMQIADEHDRLPIPWCGCPPGKARQQKRRIIRAAPAPVKREVGWATIRRLTAIQPTRDRRGVHARPAAAGQRRFSAVLRRIIHAFVGWDEQAEAAVGLRSPDSRPVFAARCLRTGWLATAHQSLARACPTLRCIIRANARAVIETPRRMASSRRRV
jgi:hypothetical protein